MEGDRETAAPSRADASASGVDDTIAELHERIEVLAAFTGGLVFEFDREGRYLRIWTGGPELLARPVKDVIGKTVREVVGDPGSRFHDAIRGVYDTGEPAAFEYALDVPAGRRTFSCVMKAYHRGERPRTVTMLVRDVTQAKELEAKLVQAERLGALGLLAASVGHEIRQPLSYVMTSLSVLERELARTSSTSGQTRTSLDKIRVGAKRIAEIATTLDLLAGQRKRGAGALDVRRPLQAALDLCASELSEIRIERCLESVPLVRADEGELCQVFANLLLNAAQSLRTAGEARGVVTVATGVEGVADARVHVTITDNGSGIAPEHLAHIFDPFFTTKEQHGGSGLGLFISRRIVEAHGGTLDITTEVGRGTTVHVRLPAALPPEISSAPGSMPRASARDDTHARFERRRRAAPAGRRLEILIVDDEPRFLDSLRLALDEDHVVETFARSADALASLERQPERYDVVLCDLAMPGIDGVAFYERMKELGVGARFVLMTGGAYTARAAQFVASNVCPSISKPFLLEKLFALLEEVTGDRPAS